MRIETLSTEAVDAIGDPEYRSLAGFRYHIRRFSAFSDSTVEAAGLAPAQYQAMLAIRAYPGPNRITVSALAERMFTRVNSTVELVQRLEAAGLVERQRSASDRRRIELALTIEGEAKLALLAAAHVAQQRRHLPELLTLLQALSLGLS